MTKTCPNTGLDIAAFSMTVLKKDVVDHFSVTMGEGNAAHGESSC